MTGQIANQINGRLVGFSCRPEWVHHDPGYSDPLDVLLNLQRALDAQTGSGCARQRTKRRAPDLRSPLRRAEVNYPIPSNNLYPLPSNNLVQGTFRTSSHEKGGHDAEQIRSNSGRRIRRSRSSGGTVRADEALPNLAATYRCEPQPAPCQSGHTFTLTQRETRSSSRVTTASPISLSGSSPWNSLGQTARAPGSRGMTATKPGW